MKTIGLFLTLISFSIGFQTGRREGLTTSKVEIKVLKSEVDRFHNPEVLRHAQYIARITGRPLYQVLTGKKESK